MLTDLNNSLLNLTGDEQRIFDARQAGVAILDMTDRESQAATTGIIFKVSVISGCQLPTHDAHINALEQEFLIFIKEFGYGKLTVEEIITAFRMNANFQLNEKIETYGSVFNIDYASKVLKQYSDKRYKLDVKLSNVHRDIENHKILSEEELKRRTKVKEQFEKYLNDENVELDLSNCYMQLVHDGAFADKKIYAEFLNKVQKLENKKGEPESVSRFLLQWNINLEQEFEASKLAVKYLFCQMKNSGKTEIYNDKWQLLYPNFKMPEKTITPEF